MANFSLMFQCDELGVVLKCDKFSDKLRKVIDAIHNPPRRPVITGSHRELLYRMVVAWEQGRLTLPGENAFEQLGDFIFRTYDVRHEDNPKKSMKKTSIVTETYEYRNL